MTDNAISGSAQKTTHNRRVGPLSLRNRLLITFILLAALPVLVTGIVSGLINTQGLRNAAFDQLASVAQLKENEISSWVESLQTTLSLAWQGEDFANVVGDILQSPDEGEKLKEDIRTRFNKWNQTAGYFDELFIMSKNGTVIISTSESQEGKIFSTQVFYREGMKGNYVTPPVYDVALSKYSIIFSQPIIDEKGDVLGVIAGRANLSTLDKIMVERVGLGETGETYLVSSNYALLSQLRFGDAKVGETYIRSTGTTNVIETQSVGSELYDDYRGTSVLGSYIWIPQLQIALVAEHDQDEALQASNRALAITLGLVVLALAIAIFAAILMTRSIVTPILQLVSVAGNITSGNLEVRALVQREDEIGTLAKAFNTMTAQLQTFIATLEQRVADRTKALATSSEVSRRLSTILDRKDLVNEVVNQVNNAFGYYHTQIYFLDEDKENLVMAGGTGEAGKLMLAQFHKVKKGRGLVGRAAESNEPVLVSNTSLNPEWLPNPLLPETKSEMAIPISIGDQVLGVLDVQHNITDGLQREDVDSLSSIANQIAVALQNIRQYENTRKIASDMGVVAAVGIATSTITDSQKLLQEVVDISKKSFNLYHAHIYLLNEAGDTLNLTAGAGEVGRQMVSEKRSIPLEREQSLVARAARTREGVLANDVTLAPDFLPNPLLPDTRSELAVPMVVADKVLGVLDVQSETVGRFTDVDISIKTTLASQIAVALQNARSFAQSQHQAERETAVNLITQKIQSATSIEAALQITARELGRVLGMKSTLVTLETDQQNLPHETKPMGTGVS